MLHARHRVEGAELCTYADGCWVSETATATTNAFATRNNETTANEWDTNCYGGYGKCPTKCNGTVSTSTGTTTTTTGDTTFIINATTTAKVDGTATKIDTATTAVDNETVDGDAAVSGGTKAVSPATAVVPSTKTNIG